MVVAYYHDERLDLGEMVREQIFLALPLKRLCREDVPRACARPAASTGTATACECQPAEPSTRGSARSRKLFDKADPE